MINIYDFVEECKENGLDASEAMDEYEKAVAEERERFLEDYYNDPEVQYGWHQQDMIDLREREM